MRGTDRSYEVPSVKWKEYNRERDEEIAAKAASTSTGDRSALPVDTEPLAWRLDVTIPEATWRIEETVGTADQLDLDLMTDRVQLYVTNGVTWWNAAECRCIAAELLRLAEALEAHDEH